jgi:hypothetical protein
VNIRTRIGIISLALLASSYAYAAETPTHLLKVNNYTKKHVVLMAMVDPATGKGISYDLTRYSMAGQDPGKAENYIIPSADIPRCTYQLLFQLSNGEMMRAGTRNLCADDPRPVDLGQ